MRKAPFLFTFGIAVWCMNPAVQALGIGRTANTSALGQPLNVVAAVQVDGDEVLTAKCISAAVFAGDAPVRADRVRIVLEPGADPRQRRVRVMTTSPIAEPLVTVNLTVGCTSRVSRSFVTLINPPVQVQSDPMELDAPAGKLADVGTAAATVALANDAKPGRARFVRNAAGRWVRVPVAPAVAVASNARAAATPPSTALPKAAPGAGTTMTSTAMRATAMTAATTTARPPASLTPTPNVPTPAFAHGTTAAPTITTARAPIAPEPLAADVKAAELTKRVDGVLIGTAGSRTPAAPTAPVAAASGQSGSVLITLAAFALLLAGIVVAMWKLLPAQRMRGSGSADAAAPVHAPAKVKAAPVAPVAAAPLAPPAAPVARRAEPPVLRDIPASASADALERARRIDTPVPPPEPSRQTALHDDHSLGGLEVTTVLDAALHARVKRSSRPEGASPSSTFGKLEGIDTVGHGPSMTDLIDVEQQAEFYIVLGQDDAAIALLDKHIAAGGGSPLPYLKLLEIHQRRKDEAAYNGIRQSFNERFKAYAPEWTEAIELGRSLEEYPATLEHVQTAWDAPLRAMKMLDGLLFRRSANEDAFDFAAYRELLFLYSIARDLSGDVVPAMGADIDLLLPLDEASIALLSRRMKPALATVSANAASMVGVDLDIAALDADRSEKLVGVGA